MTKLKPTTTKILSLPYKQYNHKLKRFERRELKYKENKVQEFISCHSKKYEGILG